MPPAAAEPPPTLEDTASLTPASDFRRFVGPGVAPEVKNAALKKLFADPHFNVMDGLDTYIGDYSQPDPMPPEMLRKLAGAQFLGMFREEEKKEQEQAAQQQNDSAPESPLPRESGGDPAPQTVAQSAQGAGVALAPAERHADPDLRLQQDDAPGPEGPGAGDR